MPEYLAHPDSWSPLFEALPQGVLLLDQEGRYLEANAAALKLLDIDRRTLMSRRLGGERWNLLAPDGTVLSVEDTPGAIALRSGKAVHRQVVGIVKIDGDVLWLEISAEPTTEEGAFVTIDDITRHHLNESILAVRARIAEQAMGSSLEEILRATLDEAERLTGSCIGFFHFMEPDQKTLTLQAWSTRTENESSLAVARGMQYSLDEGGAWEAAVHSRRPVIHNDAGDLPSQLGLPGSHTPLHRELVVPVLRGERIVALLVVGNKPFSYGNRDLQTVLRLADLAWDIAEKKRLEQALMESEARYRLMLRTSLDGVWLVDTEGRFLAVNEAACQMLGYSQQQLLARSVTDIDGVEAPEETRSHIQRLKQHGTDLFQTLHRRVDGTLIPVEVSVTFLADNQQMVVYIRDITGRQEAESMVQAEQQRFHDLVDSVDGIVWEADARTFDFTFISAKAERLLGYSLEQWKGPGFWADHIHPEDREQAIEYCASCTGHLENHDFEYRFQALDGSYLWLRDIVTVSPDESGQPRWLRGVMVDISDSKKDQAALGHSEALYRTMFEAAPIGLWEEDFSEVKAQFDALRKAGVVDLRAHFDAHPGEVAHLAGKVRILRINEASIMSLKAASEQDLVRDLARYFTPDSLQVFKEGLLALAEGKTRFRVEGPHLDAHGQLLFFDFGFTVLPGHEASLSRVLVSFLDITGKKAIENSLRASEARLQTLTEHSPDHILLLDLQGRILYINHVLQGHQLEEVIGQDWLNWMDPQAREVAQEAFDQVLESRGRVDYEVHGMGSPGETRWYGCRLSPVLENGVVKSLVLFSTDISERKRADLALLRSEHQFRSLFDSMKEGFAVHEIITDDQGRPCDYRYLEVNPAFVAMMGIPRDRWVGRRILEILPGAEARWIREFGQVALTGKPVTFEDEVKDLGRWYRVTAYRPHPGQFAALVTDVTEQKRTESAHRILEQQVARTQKMESLGSLAGGVAHDMNNVLGAIMGLASIHQEQAQEGSRLHRSMDTILKACTRGRTLVKGLLGFARQELQEVRLVDLNDLIKEEVALLEHTIPASVRMVPELAPGLGLMHGDPSSLSHMLMNLCVNAVDAMPEGGTLFLRTRNEGTDRVCLEVTDSGLGMTPAVLEKAMDPFFTTKEHGKGTGLGLAIVYGCVKAHHGQVELSSAPGAGTRVLMRFPATNSRPLPGSPSQRPGPLGHPLGILVVDDDELILDSLVELLRSMGHRPTVARSGEEALLLLEEGFTAEVVLLDLNMPGLGGTGTLPRLRAAHPDLPVLIATGRADQSAMDLVARTPGTLLLPKPFSGLELNSHLRQLGLM